MEYEPAGGGADISGIPWEQVVREISLAARPDAIDDMAGVWKKYVKNLDHYANRFYKIWKNYLDGQWLGDAADACHEEWRKIAKNIASIHDNYSSMPTLLSHCADTAHHAINTIPIPIFASGGSGNTLPANYSSGDSDSGGLYRDYQNDHSAYADYAFLKKAKGADDTHYVNGASTRDGKNYQQHIISPEQGSAIRNEDHDKLLRDAAIDNWYAGHQNTSHGAREKVVNEYSYTHSHIPGSTRFTWDQDNPDKSTHHQHSSSPASSSRVHASGGAISPPATTTGYNAAPSIGKLPPAPDGSVTTASQLPHALPPHGVLGPPEMKSPTSSTGTGSGLAGVGSGPIVPSSQVGLPASTHGDTSVPLTSGGGGWAGGGGGRSGASAVPTTTTPSQNPWWSYTPTAGPMGPRVAPPTGLSETTGPSAQPGGASRTGIGMMPHAGAGTGQRGERDERYTWLTEDDEDIWGPRREDLFDGIIK